MFLEMLRNPSNEIPSRIFILEKISIFWHHYLCSLNHEYSKVSFHIWYLIKFSYHPLSKQTHRFFTFREASFLITRLFKIVHRKHIHELSKLHPRWGKQTVMPSSNEPPTSWSFLRTNIFGKMLFNRCNRVSSALRFPVSNVSEGR